MRILAFGHRPFDRDRQPGLKPDEAPGVNCACYADILLTLSEC